MPRLHAIVILLSLMALALPCFGETPAEKDARMAWWREARFGMFIHWGLYAQAAGEWNGEEVPGVGEWIMYHGQIPREDYETLAPKFNPGKFDAQQWVELAKRAGMKYIVITSKHHDGFSMFDSKLTAYDIVDATPFKRDPLKELAEACQREGIALCFYHSIWDWHHEDAHGENFPAYVEHMKGQLRELLTSYGPIGVMWFDGEWIDEWTEEQGKALYAFCRELQPHLIINNRVGKGRAGMGGLSQEETSAGDFGTPEQEIPGRGLPGIDWETCMTMNDTWGFKTSDRHWKSSAQLIRTLIDVASKGGNFLLNVGPTALGEIPPESVDRLEAIGTWIQTNGESVYGTSASPFARLPWGRCTRKGDVLYLHVFDWPTNGVLVVPGLKNEVSQAMVLATGAEMTFTHTNNGSVQLAVPLDPPDQVVTVIALRIVGEPVVEVDPLRQREDGVIALDAIDADLQGESLRVETIGGKHNLGYWTSAEDSASWTFMVHTPGEFSFVLDRSCDPAMAGSMCEVSLDHQSLTFVVSATAGWHDFHTLELGQFSINAAGTYTLTVQPHGEVKGALMNLRRVELQPVH